MTTNPALIALADAAKNNNQCRCGHPFVNHNFYVVNIGGEVRATCKGCSIVSIEDGKHVVGAQ